MNPKLRIAITTVVVLIVLSGIYIAGNFILPNAIEASYQSKNCDQVLAQESFYTSLYPAFLADQRVATLTSECAFYSLALENEAQKAWQDAYNTYKTYSEIYPTGLLANEAQEHSALVLTSWAKDQLAARKYSDAIGNINLVLKNFDKTSVAKDAASLMPKVYIAWAKDQLAAKQYSDAVANINLVLKSFGESSAAKDATSLMPEIYIAWAKDQRDANDFAGAEETLKILKTWAENAKNAEDVKLAQRELALTYLAWGLDFQTQKQFEDAKAKLALAISTDPEPLASSAPALQAKAAQAKLYIEWGDTLIEKSDIKGALGYYQTALSVSESKDQPAIKEKIAAAHLKQADSLSSSEDFVGALKEVEQAKETATTDSVKKEIETTQKDIYLAFSKSTGEQAQQAMADAAKKICLHQQPELPIFGGDTNTIRAYLYVPGSASNLTDAVRATTPESLHYVACVTESSKTETMKSSQGKETGGITKTGPSPSFTIERVTNYWDIQLYDLKTGKVVTSQSFAGTPPPSWQSIWNFVNNSNNSDDLSYVGALPSLETVSAWVEQYMK